MSIYLRRLLLLFSLLAIGVAGPVQAKDWPSLPVKFVLPYPPGGASDVTARLLAERLGAMWKVPVTVENRPMIGPGLFAGRTKKISLTPIHSGCTKN